MPQTLSICKALFYFTQKKTSSSHPSVGRNARVVIGLSPWV
jgi:hypothetical protein